MVRVASGTANSSYNPSSDLIINDNETLAQFWGNMTDHLPDHRRPTPAPPLVVGNEECDRCIEHAAFGIALLLLVAMAPCCLC